MSGEQERLLDVGCGSGVLLERRAGHYPDAGLYGVDPVAEMLDIACGRLAPRVELQQALVQAYPFAASKLDVVVSSRVFHSFVNPRGTGRNAPITMTYSGQVDIARDRYRINWFWGLDFDQRSLAGHSPCISRCRWYKAGRGDSERGERTRIRVREPVAIGMRQ